MIIRIIATALIQCTVRTQAGWITFAGAGAGTARSSLAATLDITNPWFFHRWRSLHRIIRREPRLRYCHTHDQIDAGRVSQSQKSEPGRPRLAVAHPVGD